MFVFMSYCILVGLFCYEFILDGDFFLCLGFKGDKKFFFVGFFVLGGDGLFFKSNGCFKVVVIRLKSSIFNVFVVLVE